MAEFKNFIQWYDTLDSYSHSEISIVMCGNSSIFNRNDEVFYTQPDPQDSHRPACIENILGELNEFEFGRL